jgi:hypothetical protein
VFIGLRSLHAAWLAQGRHDRAPGEDKVMRAARLNVQPGDYRFPYSNSVKENGNARVPEKMKQGSVGNMSILLSGDINMGKLMGQWFVYSLVIAVIVAYVTGRTRAPGAPYLEVFRVSGAVTFCCYSVAHWQNWIWWGKGTRFTLTNSIDGLIYALVTAGTFGWLWPSEKKEPLAAEAGAGCSPNKRPAPRLL